MGWGGGLGGESEKRAVEGEDQHASAHKGENRETDSKVEKEELHEDRRRGISGRIYGQGRKRPQAPF